MMQNPISASEAARRLNVSRATIARLIRKGEINAEKKTLGQTSPYLIEAAEIESYRRRRQGQ